MKKKQTDKTMWEFGYGYATLNYQVEGSYYFEDEVPSEGLDMNLVEAWNSGSL